MCAFRLPSWECTQFERHNNEEALGSNMNRRSELQTALQAKRDEISSSKARTEAAQSQLATVRGERDEMYGFWCGAEDGEKAKDENSICPKYFASRRKSEL